MVVEEEVDRWGGGLRRKVINNLVSNPLRTYYLSDRCELSIHQTHTKRKRTDNKDIVSSNVLLVRCYLCRLKTAWWCSKCEEMFV